MIEGSLPVDDPFDPVRKQTPRVVIHQLPGDDGIVPVIQVQFAEVGDG
jgi:hypothetical protein